MTKKNMEDGTKIEDEEISKNWFNFFTFNRYEVLFLLCIYLISLYLRLSPRLAIDPHLLTFQGDIWYRVAMAQYIFDHHALPNPDIRYLAYGYVPMWYPPLSPIFFAFMSYISGLDIATVSSRIVPFFESLAPLSIYPLARYLYDKRVAIIATITLALTPSFVFWSGISDPQSLTLFTIPLLILIWLIHSRSEPNHIRLLMIGTILAFNFLVHLSYFLEVLILLGVTFALILEKRARKSLLMDFAKVVAISQILTAPWWLRDNLYWWWINALVTSSGMYPVVEQLQSYGSFAAILGIGSFIYITFKSGKRRLLLLLWALPLFIETQNEVILFVINKADLTWHTLAKPLEGFRFHCFLAQPISLAVGITITDLIDRTKLKGGYKHSAKVSSILWPSLLLMGLGLGIAQYDLDVKFQTSGLIVEEYDAAIWFKSHSAPSSRIIADYYRSQMFAGVCGGRALLGGVFPLRNVDYPYIKAPSIVQDDLYILYSTSSAEEAYKIARKYNTTHIFYSDNMRRYGNLLSKYKKASEYGVDVDVKKFEDQQYFKTVYKEYSHHDVIKIIEVK